MNSPEKLKNNLLINMSTQETKPTVALSLTVKDSAAALDFYTRAFNATELYRMDSPDGGIAHAEFMLGNTHMYMSDASAEWHAEPMAEGVKASCLFAITTEDCDASFKQAVDAGGEVLNEPETQFYGIRSALIKDPFGYRWSFSELVEEVSPEEMEKRAKEYAAKS